MGRIPFTGILTILVALLLMTGCQGNPSSPDVESQLAITPVQEIRAFNSHQHPAFFNVALNIETSEVSVEKWRTPEVHLNLTQLFINTMGLAIAVVPAESDPANGLFALDFTLTHPIRRAFHMIYGEQDME